jgi:hypothetical protein
MQFNIDGRFQAEVRWENDAWTVQPAATGTLLERRDAVVPAGMDGDDIANFLDDIFLESAGQGQYVELVVSKLAGW